MIINVELKCIFSLTYAFLAKICRVLLHFHAQEDFKPYCFYLDGRHVTHSHLVTHINAQLFNIMVLQFLHLYSLFLE
jgi:hypothetical protein